MSATKLKIRIYGDACLRERCDEVETVGPGERMLISAMIETMNKEKGIGLAAPQVGINKRIFVADIGEGPFAFVNPEIKRRSGKAVMDEGCLSIPGINIEVQRADQIVVHYTDENNERMEGVFSGLFARVIQHENDHLDGKLILDYASEEQLEELKDKLEAMKSSGDSKDDA